VSNREKHGGAAARELLNVRVRMQFAPEGEPRKPGRAERNRAAARRRAAKAARRVGRRGRRP
jgi:non-canonical (house-cleaning) NTP pyrophosphatase